MQVTLMQVSREGARNLEHISKRETSTKQKDKYLHCDLLLILKLFCIIKLTIKLLEEQPLFGKEIRHDRSQRGITDKRQAQFRLLTPWQNPANTRRFVILDIKHLLIIRVMKNGFLLYNPLPNSKDQSILASKPFCISVLSTGRHTPPPRCTHATGTQQ